MPAQRVRDETLLYAGFTVRSSIYETYNQSPGQLYDMASAATLPARLPPYLGSKRNLAPEFDSSSRTPALSIRGKVQLLYFQWGEGRIV